MDFTELSISDTRGSQNRNNNVVAIIIFII